MSGLRSVFRRLLKNSRSGIPGFRRNCFATSAASDPGDESPSRRSPLKTLVDEAALDRDQDEETWSSPPHPGPMSLWDSVEDEGIDPKDTCVILFPGQGTQTLGMGKSLLRFPRAREIYEVASEIVGVNLAGIEDRKTLNRHAQVSVVVNSLAALEKLREERPSALASCVATAGFSLGEITALIFAGSIPFEQGLKLVNVRAAAMSAAGLDRPGGMMTVHYGADCDIRKVCADVESKAAKMGEKDPICQIANFLYPQCVVLSATEIALRCLKEKNKSSGIRAMKELNVSGPFHTRAMEPAVAAFASALRLCEVHEPKIRTMSSMTARQYGSARQIRSSLPKQIVRPVRWQQLMQSIYLRKRGKDFPKTYEVGPGNVLRPILRKINAPAWDYSISICE